MRKTTQTLLPHGSLSQRIADGAGQRDEAAAAFEIEADRPACEVFEDDNTNGMRGPLCMTFAHGLFALLSPHKHHNVSA